jgi:predicted ATPase
MSAEGGSSNFAYPASDDPAARQFTFSQNAGRAEFGRQLRLVRGGRRPRTDFFLRAESLLAAASYLENLSPDALKSYGGTSLFAVPRSGVPGDHGRAFRT